MTTSEDGTSGISSITTTRPLKNPNYIRTRIQTLYKRRRANGEITRTAVLDLPINAIPISIKNPLPLQRTLRGVTKR